MTAAWAGGEPGADPTITVRVTAPAEFGRSGRTVSVGLDGGWAERLTVPVRFEVRDLLTVAPAAVFLGAGPAGDGFTKTVLLTGTGPLELLEPPTLTAADGSAGLAGAVTVTVKRLSPERVLVTLSGPLPGAAGAHAAVLTVKTRVTTDAGPEDRERAVRVSALTFGDSPDSPAKVTLR